MHMDLMSLHLEEIGDRLVKGEIAVAVVGLGRIGLPTAVSFAEAGAKVIGIDIDQRVVSEAREGRSKFVDEPGLNELLKKVIFDGRMKVTTDYGALAEADMVIVAVPTPVNEEKVPEYSYIDSACNSISRYLKRGALLVVESTVGPGYVERVIIPLLERGSGMKAGSDFGVASCPERANPGAILRDMRKVPRIVGGIDARSSEVAATVYERVFGVKAVKVSSPKAANAAKLMENIFRDVNIALANEFALLFERLGIDIDEVIRACSTKYNFVPHFPGAGVGGPCLPSNSYYLISESVRVGNIPYLVRMAREINDRMPEHVITLVGEAMNEVNKAIRGSKISVLGLSYKPNIRDLQLSPMEKVCVKLKEMGADLRPFDPYYRGEVVFGTRVAVDLESALKDADCILIGTAHNEIRKTGVEVFAKLSSMPAALVDTSQVIDPKEAKRFGFVYKGVGRA
jgi:nucleotide sugar dehydrogenase